MLHARNDVPYHHDILLSNRLQYISLRGGRDLDRYHLMGGFRGATPPEASLHWPLTVLPFAGGRLREHPPHHAGDEQRSDAFRCWEQRQWLSKFSHVLRQLRGPVQEAHDAAGWLQPPLAGPQRHAEPGQLPAKATLVQAQVENPKPVRC